VVGKQEKEAAATLLHAVLAEEELVDQGVLYFENCQLSGSAAPFATDSKNAEKLWKLSDSLVGNFNPSK